jgi:hypothetical protein
VTEAMLVGDVAMWADSDEAREWQKHERQRLLDDHIRVWGRPSDEFR